MNTVTESSNALSMKLDDIVSQIANATSAATVAHDARSEAYISGDAARIAQAEAKYRDATSRLDGLCAARDSINEKIKAARVLETNARIAEVRAKLADEKEAVLELADVAEDHFSAAVEALVNLVRAGDAFNATAQSIGVDRPFSRDHVAHYVESKLAGIAGSSRFRADLGVASIYATLEKNISDKVR